MDLSTLSFLHVALLLLRPNVGNGVAAVDGVTEHIEVVAGQSTCVHCETPRGEKHWVAPYRVDFLPAGSHPHDSKDSGVYWNGKIRLGPRFRMEVNESTGAHRLVISEVKMGDAGKYEWTPQEGNISKTEIIVLDSNPRCQSNINREGLIGNTSCNMEPDELELSCSVAYQGNSPPELQWVNIGSDDTTVVESACEPTINRMTCNLTRTADLSLRGTSFVCQTTRATFKQHPICSSGNITVLYTVSINLTLQTVNLSDNVTCSARSSNESCQFRWRWYKGDDVTTESQTKILTAKKPGMHRCEATCSLRGRECKFDAMIVNVTAETSTASPPVVDGNAEPLVQMRENLVPVFAALCVVGLIVVFIVFTVRRNRRPTPTPGHSTKDDIPSAPPNAADDTGFGYGTETDDQQN